MRDKREVQILLGDYLGKAFRKPSYSRGLSADLNQSDGVHAKHGTADLQSASGADQCRQSRAKGNHTAHVA